MNIIYLVATPIGNMDDITLRALEVLKCIDIALCEDTRISAKLFSHHSIKACKLVHYNDFCSDKELDSIRKIITNKTSALLSSAGHPAISDPGQRLVNYLMDYDFKIVPIPGPCAITTAFMVSGIKSDSFCFCGFLPKKDNAKMKVMSSFLNTSSSLIFFEKGANLLNTIELIDNIFCNPQIFVAKEMTKLFERFFKGNAKDILIDLLSDSKILKGEFVVIVNNSEVKSNISSIEDYIEFARFLLKSGHSAKATSEKIHSISGISKREIYQFIVKLT